MCGVQKLREQNKNNNLVRGEAQAVAVMHERQDSW